MKENIKKKALHRLKIAQGQIQGLLKMVEAENYCIDVINQSLAVKEALSSFENLMLENHLSTHVIDQIKKGQHSKVEKEILSIYKLSKKK